MCIYIYTYTCVHMYMYICIYMYIFVCICRHMVCIRVICVRAYIGIFVHTHTCFTCTIPSQYEASPRNHGLVTDSHIFRQPQFYLVLVEAPPPSGRRRMENSGWRSVWNSCPRRWIRVFTSWKYEM